MNTVSRPESVLVEATHAAISRVQGYRPLPRVDTWRRSEYCAKPELLNRDALGQIARLVDVAAPANGNVVSQ